MVGVVVMSRDYYTGENGKRYFNMRHQRRNVKAQIESAKSFSPYITSDSVVLDFGCGTGGLINNINCSKRLGVEINEPSIEIATQNGIEVYRNINDVPDGIVDTIISHHAIEHVEEPLNILKDLYKKLKNDGMLIVVVPAEEPRKGKNKKWVQEKDKHLYSWNPLTLGNLMEVAGFKVTNSYVLSAGYSHYIEWSRNIPILFNLLKKLVALTKSRYHTVCIGEKSLE